LKIISFVALSSIVFLSACGESAPKCDSDDAKKLIKYYLPQALFNAPDLFMKRNGRAYLEKYGVNIDFIRLIGKNDELKTSQCAAELNMGDLKHIDLDYTLVYTTDHKLYITMRVSGWNP
jgi:hypothetical protein